MKEPIRTTACGGTAGAVVSVGYHLPMGGIAGIPQVYSFPPHAAIFFTMYETTKKILETNNVPHGVQWPVAAVFGEYTASVVSFPIYSVFTRRLVIKAYVDKPKFGTGPLTIAGQILKREGLSGFYKGFSSNILNLMSSAIVLFPTYEFLKSRLQSGQTEIYESLPKIIEKWMKEPGVGGFCFGAMAGIVTGVLLTPVANAAHAVDAHLLVNEYIGGKAEVKMMWESMLTSAQKGLRSFYAGGVLRTFHVTMFSIILFGTYEFCKAEFSTS